jgi:hypothetical protein
MFPHQNIHKYTWTSPDGNTHNQIDHVLIDRRLHSSKTGGIKQAAQKFDAERFNLKKLSELEVRKQYQIKISNRFAALENLNVSEDINRAWEIIKESIKISAKESLGLYFHT